MFPPLHCVDLLTNTVFQYLQRWWWYRVEEVPLELLEARFDWKRTSQEKVALLEKKVSAEEHLAELEAELASYVFDEDPEDGDPEYDFHLDLVRNAELEAEKYEIKYENADKVAKAAKRKLTALEGKKSQYGKAEQELWMVIQNKLKEDFNIFDSVFHGGDMVGPECRRLLRRSDDVMTCIQDFSSKHISLLPESDKEHRADAEEIGNFCGGFRRLFQYMDVISHYCYQPYGSLSDADCQCCEDTIMKAIRLWLKLMPTIPMKVHAWLHLVEDIWKYRGLGTHNEHTMERSHQRGKREMSRLRCLNRNPEKKANNILIREATLESEEVQKMLADTEGQRKRRKRRSDNSDEVHQKRIEMIREIMLLPEIEAEFPTMFDLQTFAEDIDE